MLLAAKPLGSPELLDPPLPWSRKLRSVNGGMLICRYGDPTREGIQRSRQFTFCCSSAVKKRWSSPPRLRLGSLAGVAFAVVLILQSRTANMTTAPINVAVTKIPQKSLIFIDHLQVFLWKSRCEAKFVDVGVTFCRLASCAWDKYIRRRYSG